MNSVCCPLCKKDMLTGTQCRKCDVYYWSAPEIDNIKKGSK